MANEDLVAEGVLSDYLERSIDPGLVLEEPVERMLQLMAEDFAESALSGACELAKHRNGGAVTVNDLSTHLLTQWGIRVPGYRSETSDRLDESLRDVEVPPAHRARLEIRAQMRADDEI
jgi:transcription initiation factor TFIID subunit TAF12